MGSKIAPIMLEIKFYIIKAIKPVLAKSTLFWRFGITLVQYRDTLVWTVII